MDAILATSRAWFAEPDAEGRVCFPGQPGAETPAALHSDFAGNPRQLLGKCKDLSDAFKQLAVSPADESVSVIAVYDPWPAPLASSRRGRCRLGPRLL